MNTMLFSPLNLTGRTEIMACVAFVYKAAWFGPGPSCKPAAVCNRRMAHFFARALPSNTNGCFLSLYWPADSYGLDYLRFVGNKTMVMTLAPHPKKDRFGWGFVIDS